MQLKRLSLSNFRNFIRLEATFPDGPTVLVGANAQGKTSLLEAVNYLVVGSSPHATSDRQLINFLAQREPTAVARVVGEVARLGDGRASGGREARIEIRVILEPAGPTGERRLRKEVLINGVKRRLSDLSGVFNAVLFLPQDLQIIEGSPSARRRHLDSILFQTDPIYADALSSYGKVLTQRNALLKQLAERGGEGGQLTFWDEQLAGLGARLIRSRALALSELEHLATPIHQALSRGRETLRIAYQPSFDPIAKQDGQLNLALDVQTDWSGVRQEAIQADMIEALERNRKDELGRGMTLLGPHRDEVLYQTDGLDLRLYGSRGQIRTAMLAVKFAEVEWIEARTGEQPALLLDEVLAELDAARRADLLRRLQDGLQSLLTAADLEMFEADFLERASVWQVEAGTIIKEIRD